MIKNRKAKGNRNEHRSIAILEAAGYRCTRSAASLGCWDIVAVGATGFVLVQVKSRDYPGTVEMETLRGFAVPPNCKKLIHRWRARQRLPDVKEVL
jgi:Holliday junction resolvase